MRDIIIIMSLFRLEEKRKEYEISAKKRTKVAVYRDVYELIRYYAMKKNKTVTQATYEIIREGFRTTGWFK